MAAHLIPPPRVSPPLDQRPRCVAPPPPTLRRIHSPPHENIAAASPQKRAVDTEEGEAAGGGDKPKPKRTRKIACINCACCTARNVETQEPKPVSTGLKVLFALANNSCSGISGEKQHLCSACKETVKGKSTQTVLDMLTPLVLQGPSGAGKSGCPARLGSRRPVPLRMRGLSGISLAGRPAAPRRRRSPPV